MARHLSALKKKSATTTLTKQIPNNRHPNPPSPLLRPHRSPPDLLIEKTVELGVTNMHAVTTDYTQNHNIKKTASAPKSSKPPNNANV